MKSQTNLVRRGPVYYFRARLPVDLKAHYGKREILTSLGTKDKQEALLKARKRRLDLDLEFASARALITSGKASLVPDINAARIAERSQLGSGYSLQPAYESTLKKLFEYWSNQGDKRPRTLLEARSAIDRLESQSETSLASHITKAHIVQFKDGLLADGKAHATVIKQLNLIRAIFQTALDNDLLPENPVSKVRVAKSKTSKKARIPFALEDLQQIFSSDIYTANARPSGGAGEASYWLPLLAVWTGARLEELGQLHVMDVIDKQGVPIIHITNDNGDKRLKTPGSKREVPIHPELIKYGFLHYVEDMKKLGEVRLFPLVESAPGRQKSASFSQWFGRHLRFTLGITDSRKVFHSFRHGFKDACRDSGIGSELHDRLTGHTSSSIGDSYGSEYYPLRPLQIAIQQLSYPGLNLNHLYR